MWHFNDLAHRLDNLWGSCLINRLLNLLLHGHLLVRVVKVGLLFRFLWLLALDNILITMIIDLLADDLIELALLGRILDLILNTEVS